MEKNIIVTGGAGFIGSHLTDALIEQGNRVIVIDDLSTGYEKNINKSCEFIKIDIRDRKIEDIFKKYKIDLVYHLAAQIDVRKSVEDPLFDADINIMGSINLLQNASSSGVDRFVFVSSGGVMYGECSDLVPDETAGSNPLSPYGDSKLAIEYYLNHFKENCGLDTVVLRLGNVYGPRQDPHGEAGVVALFSNAMLKNSEVKIFGDGNQLRDYVFVEDVVQALISAGNTGSGIYNIGTGESQSVIQLYRILSEVTGYESDPVYYPPRQGELQVSKLGVSKAEEEIKWKAITNFKEGLIKTVEYFKEEN